MPSRATSRTSQVSGRPPGTHAPQQVIEAVLPHRLRPPKRRNALIERPDLLARVEAGLAGRVVSLRAPAGYGKTELLISAFEHFSQPGNRFCWMTLDRVDTDIAVFFNDLAAAAQSAGLPARAIRFEARSRSSVGDAGDPLAAIAEILAASPMPLTVLMDDGDAPDAQAFRESMGILLRRFPDSLRIVLASRSRPAIALSVLRTRQLLTEISASDLAFSRQDAQALFEGEDLPEAERLLDVTEGWPALMALARVEFQRTSRDDDRVSLLAGDHVLFRDFIEDEVLAPLPSAFSRALEVCTVLDAVPLDLVAHLTGTTVDIAMQASIDGLSPIIEAQTQQKGWFRLHPIVHRTLDHRSRLRCKAETAALHVRAASWFAERGILDLAVRHAARGGDFGLAVEAIRRAGGVNIFLRAGYTTLQRLLADLPADVIQQSSVLRLAYALVLAKQGQIQSGRQIIDRLKALGPGPETISAADLEHIDGMIDIYEDSNLGIEQIARLRRAAQDFNAYDKWERGWIYNHLCIAYQRCGDLQAARHTGLRALTCYREERTPYAQIFMMAHVGTVLMAGGRLAAAVNLLRDAESLVRDTQGTDANIAALVHICLATCLYHQGHVAQALSMLGSALPVTKQGEGWVDMFARGYATLARATFLAAGLEAGLAVLDEAEVLAVERILPRLDVSVSLLRAELLTRAGLLDSALHVLERLPAAAIEDDLQAAWPTLRERHEGLATWGRLLIRQGSVDRGLAAAERLLASAEASDMGLDLVTARVLMLEALWALQRHDEALRQLLALLALAIPQQATQALRDGDAPVAGILRAILRRFGLSTFRPEGIAYLAAILGPLQPRKIGLLHSSAAVVLTGREAEVLAGLDRGASNKEIARALNLTEAAVKFHLKNLFRKLGVSRRTLAISVAKDLGLLDKGS